MPFKASEVVTPTMARRVWMGTATVTFLIDCHLLWNVVHTSVTRSTVILTNALLPACRLHDDSVVRVTWARAWHYVDVTLFAGLPFCCILLLNLYMVVAFWQQDRRMSRMTAFAGRPHIMFRPDPTIMFMAKYVLCYFSTNGHLSVYLSMAAKHCY